MNTNLPDKLQQEIEQAAKAYADANYVSHDDQPVGHLAAEVAWEAGATEYALLLQSEQEKRKEAEQAMEGLAFHILHLHKVVEQMKEKGQRVDMDFVMIKAQEALLIHHNYKSKKDGTVNK